MVTASSGPERGEQMVDVILFNTVLTKIGGELLTHVTQDEPSEQVHVSVEGGEFGYGFE